MIELEKVQIIFFKHLLYKFLHLDPSKPHMPTLENRRNRLIYL